MSVKALPVISLKDLETEEGRQRLAEQFAGAASTFGFMQIVDHGVPEKVMQDMFDAAETLFALPLEDKLSYRCDSLTLKGYELIGGQTLSGRVGGGHESYQAENYGAADLKEGWTFGPTDFSEASPHFGKKYHGPNKYPTETQVPGLERVVGAYFQSLMPVVRSFFRVVGSAATGNPSAFDEGIDDPLVTLKAIRYPPQPKDKDQIGAGAHSDYGLTTWLATDGAPGLEVYVDGAWEAVVATPGAFILNVGDLLSEWSGRRFKSALHRVINKSPGYRYSMPFFVEGDTRKTVRPYLADGSLGAPFSIAEHFRMRAESTLVAEK